MFYTDKLDNNKLGTYTDNPNIALDMELNITVPEIEIGHDGLAYVAGFAPKATAKNYVAMRIAEYPSITDQLDMIYWDKTNGTNVWHDTISAIKEKYPKQ